MFTTKDDTSCVLTNNGNLYIWGFDIYNVKCRFNRAPRTPKLMNPHRFQDYSGVINKVTLKEEEKLVAIDAGVEFLGAITESGRVFMWGCNSEGQLGNGSIIAAFTPTLIPQKYFNNEKVIALNLGYYNSCAITESDNLYMWGYNKYGQLGLGNTADLYTPTLISKSYFGNEKIIDISLGAYHTIALTESNRVYICGSNEYGQIADKYLNIVTSPKLIPQSYFNDEKVIAVRSGYCHVGVLTEYGNIYLWGRNENGQIGNGNMKHQWVPQLIPQSIFDNEKIVKLCLGAYHTSAITKSGQLYMWGKNCSGQLGDGTDTEKTIPILIPPNNFNNETITDISLGFYHSVVITESGKLYMCGNNEFGQLGIDDMDMRLIFKSDYNINDFI